MKGFDEVESSNPYFSFKYMKLTKINKTHMCFNGLVEIKREDISADKLKINIKGYQKYPNGWQVSPLIYLEKKFLCETFETEKMIVPGIIAASNYTKDKCPPAKGVYSFTNYIPDPDKLPENIPGEQWKVSIDVLNDVQILSTLNTYFNIIQTRPNW
ncbi:uncharacterized protein LOC123290936 [Chrysoperla carnea]|uniref:uncharacterized protein LOC123290936 n=1 Tax=Chrysoperla carnea TaxID=189513 RepID=UPI001D05EA15|nr:uncharacterized protein LOC123290936 [Chrysoperla carnea]